MLWSDLRSDGALHPKRSDQWRPDLEDTFALRQAALCRVRPANCEQLARSVRVPPCDYSEETKAVHVPSELMTR